MATRLTKTPRLVHQRVLMFSGGRDSTLAAVQLAAQGRPITLATVSSDHLYGVERVRTRIDELSRLLPKGSTWLRLRQPQTDSKFGAAFAQTCLPCQHDYALTGALIAAERAATHLAFGYASYQADWPEQTPLAIAKLRTILADNGIELELPVYHLASKSEAQGALANLGLSEAALEQKCMKQVFNIALQPKDLEIHLAHWASELQRTIARAYEFPLEILEQVEVGCLAPA